MSRVHLYREIVPLRVSQQQFVQLPVERAVHRAYRSAFEEHGDRDDLGRRPGLIFLARRVNADVPHRELDELPAETRPRLVVQRFDVVEPIRLDYLVGERTIGNVQSIFGRRFSVVRPRDSLAARKHLARFLIVIDHRIRVAEAEVFLGSVLRASRESGYEIDVRGRHIAVEDLAPRSCPTQFVYTVIIYCLIFIE